MTYPPQQPGPQQQPGQPGQPYPQQPGAYPPGYQMPPAAAPAKKKGMGTGKILLLVLGGVLLLCCGGGGIFMAVGASKSTSSAGSTTSNADAGAAPAAAKAKVGQAVRDGKFEFVVQKVECGKKQVGDQYLNKAAQGQFCLVSVSVKNVGTKAQMFDGSSQKAAGAGAVKYTNDGTAEMYANKDTATFLNEINPGNQVAGVLVFDIPQGAKITSLELHDSPFSGGVTVDVS